MGMGNDAWYDYFLKSLSARYPKKGQLAEELMDLLCIEREAVYRRLRKDVIFPVFEVAKIAYAWNISLDEIIDIDSGKIIFQMQQLDYVDPQDKEEYLIQAVIDGLLRTKDFPDTEYMEVCNRLPRPLLAGYGYLNQFYLFRWIYQYHDSEEIIPLSQIIISDRKKELTRDYYRAIKQVPNTNFVFDYKLFDNLVSDIQYFHSIRLITDEEKDLIKKDLYALLDYLSEVANKGHYPETKNKVNLYVSRLSVDTNYSYFYSNEASMCFVHAFDKYEIYTYNLQMVNSFISWMKLKRRTSIQISEVDEKSRIDFFEKQQQIVETL